MLTLKNVRKTFGTMRVLDKVSFPVGEGQKVALVGTVASVLLGDGLPVALKCATCA